MTALSAASVTHAQSRPASAPVDKQTVLPVWNKGSGKVEAILLLEPTGEAGPGARWRFGNTSLDAAFGLGAGNSLGLLCSGPGGGDINSLASHCLLASLGADGRNSAAHRLSATTAISRQGNRFGLTAGTTQGAALPAWLSADGGTALARGDHVEQNDLQVFGQKSLGEEAYVSIAGTYARARLVPLADAAPGLADRWDSKSLSVGGGYGPFSANIVGRVVDVPGQPDSKWEGLGLGLTWRTPWSGQLTVGAENVVSRGKNPFSPSNGDADEGTVPYVRYEQGL
ncbi:XOO1806 family protein [Pseudoxanthomonas sp. 10H]|uniref:XOO1806 family protein n=1 Tax=Pseudoxanthomonas sp. 10H TaxID=3242729 RepID=UPI0035567B2D